MRNVWYKYSEFLRGGFLSDATFQNLTVDHAEHVVQVSVEEGLSEAHYDSIAPHLQTDEEKVALALGVIENVLMPISYLDWMDTKRVLEEELGCFEDWLLQCISDKGIGWVANEIWEWWIDFRRTNPAPRIESSSVIVPTWDSCAGVLVYGSERWTFRVLPGRPLMEVMNAFERAEWSTAVTLPHLDPEQVSGVGKILRKKTGKHIYWKVAADCTICWMRRGP